MWNIPQELTFLLEFWVSVFYIPFNNFSYFQNDVNSKFKTGLYKRRMLYKLAFIWKIYWLFYKLLRVLLLLHFFDCKYSATKSSLPSLTLTTIRDNWYCNFYLKNRTCHVNMTVKVNLMAFWMTWYCISYFFPYSVPWFLFYK